MGPKPRCPAALPRASTSHARYPACMPVVSRPTVLSVVAREGEEPQVLGQLSLGCDNIDGGLTVVLAALPSHSSGPKLKGRLGWESGAPGFFEYGALRPTQVQTGSAKGPPLEASRLGWGMPQHRTPTLSLLPPQHAHAHTHTESARHHVGWSGTRL